MRYAHSIRKTLTNTVRCLLHGNEACLTDVHIEYHNGTQANPGSIHGMIRQVTQWTIQAQSRNLTVRHNVVNHFGYPLEGKDASTRHFKREVNILVHVNVFKCSCYALLCIAKNEDE